MRVRDAMSPVALTVGPGHTMRQASRQMTERSVGSAVVLDGESEGPGIVTERDVLECVGQGQDVDTELVADHRTTSLTLASPDWSLDEATATMLKGGYRHLVVCEGSDVVGVLSVRDVARAWSQERAAVAAGA
jgi:signal-transduction protein with cAMP-binding, CBS, and nucleotidyltransferase domain